MFPDIFSSFLKMLKAMAKFTYSLFMSALFKYSGVLFCFNLETTGFLKISKILKKGGSPTSFCIRVSMVLTPAAH